MTIQILGGGCAKCKKLEESAVQAAAEMNLDAEIVKVTDMDEIMEMGVMVTPALAVDGNVKSSGKVLTPAQVKEYLSAE